MLEKIRQIKDAQYDISGEGRMYETGTESKAKATITITLTIIQIPLPTEQIKKKPFN